MGKQQAVEPVYARRVQIVSNNAFVIPLAPAIEQPIRAPGSQMNGRTRADIQHSNPGLRIIGRTGMFDIIMSTGDLSEQMDESENEPGQTPIGIIKNDRDPREQRRREKREERNRQNEEGDWNDKQVRK